MKNLYPCLVAFLIGLALYCHPLYAQTYDTLALKYGEAYNFNVGDEFHYICMGWSSGTVVKTIITITDVDYSPGNDTLYYDYEEIGFSTSPCDIPTTTTHTAMITNLDDYIIQVGDSTAEIMEYIIIDGDTLNSFVSVSYVRDVTFEANPSYYNGKRLNREEEDFYYGLDSGEGYTYTYIEGCGGFQSSYWTDFSGWYKNLVYFRKGAESWGTPLSYEEPIPVTPLNSMTIGEAFDFEVGDVFHFVDSYPTPDRYVKRTVTAKAYNAASAEAYYVYQDSVFQVQSGGTVNAYTVQKTQLVTHLNSLCFDYDTLNDTLPAFLGGACDRITYSSCGLLENYLDFPVLAEFVYLKATFVQGCGMYARYPEKLEELLYYKKMNGEECGTPVLYTSATDIGKPGNLTATFEPLNNRLRLTPDNYLVWGATFTLFNAMGQLVQQQTVLPKTGGMVQLPNLANGLYFYHVTTPADLAISGKLLLRQ